jgi:uncharacterized membrane protein
MSASTSHASWPAARAARPVGGWRFGVVAGDGVEWTLKRNCSITPVQLLAAYAGLCVLSLGVAGFFWMQGARLVMPFAWCELLAVAMALLAFARHAGDRERIALGGGRLLIETTDGGRVERIEFAQDTVRVETGRDERSLIDLTSRGERIAVGRHVRPELRPWLAAELRDALREQPRGATV